MDKNKRYQLISLNNVLRTFIRSSLPIYGHLDCRNSFLMFLYAVLRKPSYRIAFYFVEFYTKDIKKQWNSIFMKGVLVNSSIIF